VADFERVVTGLVQNDYYEAFLLKLALMKASKQMMKVLSCGFWRFFLKKTGRGVFWVEKR